MEAAARMDVAKRANFDISRVAKELIHPCAHLDVIQTDRCMCMDLVSTTALPYIPVYLSTTQIHKGFVTMQEIISAATAPRLTRCPKCNDIRERILSPHYKSRQEAMVISVQMVSFNVDGSKTVIPKDMRFTYNGKVVVSGHHTYTVTAIVCRVPQKSDTDADPDDPKNKHFVTIVPRGSARLLVDEDDPIVTISPAKTAEIMKGIAYIFLARILPKTKEEAEATQAAIAKGETPDNWTAEADDLPFEESKNPLRASRGQSEAPDRGYGKAKQPTTQTQLTSFFPTLATPAPPQTTPNPAPLEEPTSTPISILQHNITSTSLTKLNAIRSKGATIICLQETWKPGTKVNGYDTHEWNRPKQDRGGGVCTLIKNSTKALVERLPYTGNLEVVKLKIFLPDITFTLTNVYNPPDFRPTESDLDLLMGEGPTLIVGDFNVHLPEYQPSGGWSGRDDTASISAWMHRHSLDCANANNTATYETANVATTPDYTFFTQDFPINADQWTPTRTIHSAHSIITFPITPTVPKQTPPYRPRFKWEQANWEKFSNLVDTEMLAQQAAPRNTRHPGKRWKHFARTLVKAAKQAIPFRTPPSTNDHRTITPAMRKAETDTMEKKNKWLESPNEKTKEEFHTARRTMQDLFSEERRKILKAHFDKLNPGQGADWNTIRGLKKPVPPALATPLQAKQEDGSMKQCLKEADRANALSKVYARHNEAGKSDPRKIKPRNCCPPPVTESELLASLRSAKTGTAPGPDAVHTELLLHLGPVALAELLYLCNHSITTGFIPQFLKNAIIIPLLKPGKPPPDPLSYRPVSLTSVLAKIIERIAVRRTAYYYTPHEHQYAYQAQKGGDHAVALCVDTATRAMADYCKYEQPKKKDNPSGPSITNHRVKRSLACLIDMSAAFDKVRHSLLIEQLVRRDLPPYLIRWFRSFLRGRQAKTKVGSTLSRSRPVRCGVPQGTVSGPMLFLIYVDSLLEVLNAMPGILAIMFADDLTIMTSGQTKPEAAALLQPALKVVEEWAAANNMAINGSKSQLIMFCRTPRTDEDRADCPMTINGDVVPIQMVGTGENGSSPTVKLLGVHLDGRMNLDPHLHNTAAAAHIRAAQIACISNKKYGPKPKDIRAFTKGYLESALLHGTALTYGRSHATSYEGPEKVQRRGCRSISGALASTTPTDVYMEANCLPIRVIAEINAMKLAITIRQQYKEWLRKPPPQPPPNWKSKNQYTNHFHDLNTRLEELLPHTKLRSKKPRLTIAPQHTSLSNMISFGVDLSSDGDKLQTNLDALEPYKDCQDLRLATDGSAAENNCRAACILRSNLPNQRPLSFPLVQNCSHLACSYDTEAVAMRNGIDLLYLGCIRTALLAHAPSTAIVLTDSQSLVSALQRGPLLQDNPLLIDTWARLLEIAQTGVKVHIQFIYAHQGLEENEKVDELAGNCNRTPEKPIVENTWEVDAIAKIKRTLTEKWRSSTGGSPHRQALVGTRMSPLSGDCLITGKSLSRLQHVELTRLRTGETTWGGAYYYRVRRTVHACRWCYPPANIITDAELWDEPKQTRTNNTCTYCNKEFKDKSLALKHEKDAHKDKEYVCIHNPCTYKNTHKPSRRAHYIKCPYTPANILKNQYKEEIKANQKENDPVHTVQGPTEETIEHLLVCPHLKDTRDRLLLNKLHDIHKWRLFFSLPFLIWAKTIFGVPLDEDDDYTVPDIPPSHNATPDNQSESEEEDQQNFRIY